jgi:Glyoxalase-like domain
MIDHLVLATPDVAATAAAIGGGWGIALTPGGSHVGMGTRNELTGLGGSTYLEVVGPDDGQPDPAGPRPFGIDDLTEPRLVAWCARPRRRVEDVVAAASALGIDLGGVAEMSRRRPDGVLLQWRLTFPLLSPPFSGTVPFLIDWLESPHPTASLPHDCELLELQITHPQADLVRAVIAEVGAMSRTSVSAGTAGLAAQVRTPNGVVSL